MDPTHAAALATLIATVPDQDTVYAAGLADHQAIVARAKMLDAAGVGAVHPLEGAGVTIGARELESVDAAAALDDHGYAVVGVAHHVFNVLSTPRSAGTMAMGMARSRLDLVNVQADWLPAEIAWRAAARDDAALATYLQYWDSGPAHDLTQPGWTVMLDALEAAVPAVTKSLRAAMVAACRRVVDVPATTPLADAALDAATFDDVLTLVQAARA
jgi:hypothetical protein